MFEPVGELAVAAPDFVTPENVADALLFRYVDRNVLGMGFEPMSSARKAKMIGRTTPTERILAFRVLQFNPIEIPAL